MRLSDMLKSSSNSAHSKHLTQGNDAAFAARIADFRGSSSISVLAEVGNADFAVNGHLGTDDYCIRFATS